MRLKVILFGALVSMGQYGRADMPAKKPVLGVKKLSCIAVRWNNNKDVDEQNCGNMAQAVKQFYERNSRGKVTMKTFVGTVQMGVDDGPGKIDDGEKAALKKFPGADYYIIPNTDSSGQDHAGGKIAHMNQILNTVAEHEVGHLLGLGHCTRLDVPDACCDKGSIMNPESKPSNFLTAPQYYYLGWMNENEYVSYTQAATIELKHPLDQSAGTSAVIVPPAAMGKPADSRYAFVSFAPMCDSGEACVVIHMANGGSTQLVKGIAVGKSYYDADHTKLDIAVSASAPGRVKINVSIH